jgi:hypothetical protein
MHGLGTFGGWIEELLYEDNTIAGTDCTISRAEEQYGNFGTDGGILCCIKERAGMSWRQCSTHENRYFWCLYRLLMTYLRSGA